MLYHISAIWFINILMNITYANIAELASTWSEWWTYEGISGSMLFSRRVLLLVFNYAWNIMTSILMQTFIYYHTVTRCQWYLLFLEVSFWALTTAIKLLWTFLTLIIIRHENDLHRPTYKAYKQRTYIQKLINNEAKCKTKCKPKYNVVERVNPLLGTGNYSAHRISPAQSPPRCTKCNSPPINDQCTNFILFDMHYNSLCPLKG